MISRDQLPILGRLAFMFGVFKLCLIIYFVQGTCEDRVEHELKERQHELRRTTQSIEDGLQDVSTRLVAVGSPELSSETGRQTDESLEQLVAQRQELLVGGQLKTTNVSTRLELLESVPASEQARYSRVLDMALQEGQGARRKWGTTGGMLDGENRLLRALTYQENARPRERGAGVVLDIRELFNPLRETFSEESSEWIVRDPEGRTRPLSTVRLPERWQDADLEAMPRLMRRLETRQEGRITLGSATAEAIDALEPRQSAHIVNIEITPRLVWTVVVIQPSPGIISWPLSTSEDTGETSSPHRVR